MYQKRHRTTFNQYQLKVLEEAFSQNSYPSATYREALAAKTNLDASRVQVWFQNRRAKRKKQMNQAIRFAAATNHHHRPLLGPIVGPQQAMEQHCAALQQQQMALDLHLNTALGGLQQQQQQQHSASPATNGSTNGIASSFMDQVSLYGQGHEYSSQLAAGGGPASLDLQLAAGAHNEDSSNLLYNRHWLTCSNVLSQQQDHQQEQQQQQQQIFDNLVNQQVIHSHQQQHHQHQHQHQQDQLMLSNSSLSPTTSNSSSQNSLLEVQCNAGSQQQQQQQQLEPPEEHSHQLEPHVSSLGISASVMKLETQNFHHYDQQRQQPQQHPKQQQQHCNYYKQINCLTKSTVDYLH